MGDLISAQELRQRVIGINRLRQQDLLAAGKQTRAKVVADRIVEVEQILEKNARGIVLEESSVFDYIEVVHELLEMSPAGPGDGRFWGCEDFPTGLDSVLWDVVLLNASPSIIQYHRRIAQKSQAVSSSVQTLIEELGREPDLEQQYHRGLRPNLLEVQALLDPPRTIDLDVPDARFDRDLEARSAYLLAEMFLVKDCQMTKDDAYESTAILLWYVGVLADGLSRRAPVSAR